VLGVSTPSSLYENTGGNAFFISEIVADPGPGIPETVRDAVLARAYRLPADARAMLDVVSLVPGRTERELLAAMTADDVPGLDRCLDNGMLIDDAGTVRFRHEIARLAVHEALPMGRRIALHRAVISELRSAPTPAEPARLVHHAELAHDEPAIIEFAPPAAERAAALGAHRQAAAHYATALRHAGTLSAVDRATLLERLAYESYLTDDMVAATAAREDALAVRRQIGEPLRVGDNLRWLSRLYWFSIRKTEAEEAGGAAVTVLEAVPPSRELAMAYSNRSQLGMLADDTAAAVAWGDKALQLADELGDVEVQVHALNNVGTARWMDGDLAGRSQLERSLELALERGLEEHVARAYTNLLSQSVATGDFVRAARYGDDGIAYCTEHDLDSWTLYMGGWRARLALETDDWLQAASHATEVLSRRGAAPMNRILALVVLGLVRGRKGDAAARPLLDEALLLAHSSGEVQRLGPVAAAQAELAWLAGESAPAVLIEALALAVQVRDRSHIEALRPWTRRFGLPMADSVPEPNHRAVNGPRSRYDRALEAIEGSDPDALRDAAAWLRTVGAGPALVLASARLRALGAPGVRQAHGSTRSNPAGLTAREMEVLRLVAAGLSNAAIAKNLVLSSRTVDHHVSAVLRKLDAANRLDAVEAAERLAIALTD
jgi:DNA-binding CsgD family transcriptional regulator